MTERTLVRNRRCHCGENLYYYDEPDGCYVSCGGVGHDLNGGIGRTKVHSGVGPPKNIDPARNN
jgi:hypothetical protein